MNAAAKERTVPIALIAMAIVLGSVAAVWRLGPSRGAQVLALVLAMSVFGTLLMVVAAFATAALTGTSFGDFRSAVLKLAAIYLFPTAIGALFPIWVGLVFSGAISFSLLLWLFDLEVREARVFTAIELVVNLIVLAAAASLII